jgi:cytoskeletal protein CcmA (bactofilin family)
MKNKLMILGLAVMLLIPGAVYPELVEGAIFTSGENVILDQPANENVYAAGGMVRQTAAVSGDLIVAGGNLLLTGSTTDDLLAGGGQVDIDGAVGQDLRLAGGNLTLRGPVGGDAVIVGGSITILPEAPITGDLSIAAGEVNINSRVGGDVTIRAEKITIGEQTVIAGKLTYYSGQEIVIPPGAQLQGGVEYHPISRSVSNGTKAAVLGVATVTWLIFKLLMLFLAAWILSAILGAAAPSLVTLTAANFWRRLGWGFVTLIVAPIFAVLLFVTVLGIPFGLAVFSLYFLMLVLAYIFTVIFTGSWLFRKLNKTGMYEANWKTAALGSLAITILCWIPIVGWIAYLILFLVSFGAVASLLLGWLRGTRI